MPVLPGHHGRGALHPGPGAAAVRDAQRPRRLAGRPTAGAAARSRDALDLCLACKGCKADCPANVDMATYKAEFLAHHWQGRPVAPPALRPHRSAGCRSPPAPSRACGSPGLINTVTPHPAAAPGRPSSSAASRHREIPLFASRDPPAVVQDRTAPRDRRPPGHRRAVARHVHELLPPARRPGRRRGTRSAGWRVELPSQPLCCGLTWISTGQLATGKKILKRDRGNPSAARPERRLRRRASSRAARASSGATPPSCSPTTRTCARLSDHTQDPRRAAHRAHPRLPAAAAHPAGRFSRRCTATSTRCSSGTPTASLLQAAGAEAEHLETGCCGLAGNFGFQAGHGPGQPGDRRARAATEAARGQPRPR